MHADLRHRPWAIPPGPWVMRQVWHDLLFAHWPVPLDLLRPTLPPGLVPDTYAGQAWVAVVPFRMSGIRPRGLPAVPRLSSFLELNLRTYVTAGGKGGVFFYCLDASNPLAVAIARGTFRLPYYNARMSLADDGTTIRYHSQRTHRGVAPAEVRVSYGPDGPVQPARPGSLEHWLTERYCLYTADARGRLYRGEIHHAPWPLQPATAEFSTNTMPQAHGLVLPDSPPLLHFARRLDVVVWPLRRVL